MTVDPAQRMPCVVFLPGTLCDGRVFARQARALRGLARVLRPDFRRLKDRDAWLRRLLRDLPPRFSLAGFSLGGLLALELLRMAPERVERLAMIASNAEGASRKGHRRGRANWRLQKDRRQGAKAVIARSMPLYFHAHRQRQRHAATVVDMALHTPSAAARAQYAWAGKRPGGHEVLARFHGPLLIASGARDPLCPPGWQRAMRRTRPDALWQAIPRCGHFVPFEAAAALNHALHHWIAQPAAASAPPPTHPTLPTTTP
jgi:pimeloyl-ACP methyl ester carboxylesterase